MKKNDEPAVIVKDLHKNFTLPHEQHSGIKQAAISIFNGKRGYEKQQVLKNISFEIKRGEFFGIVGRNGSGKSTLLKLLAGIYAPDKGLIQVNGSLTPFIELGVGFNPELTGRENVFLNGALLGFSRDEMAEMYGDIVSFAELEKFMDQKLKNYSSGMQVRLAFSIAIRANSDILLLDEVLAVGDAIFQKKCYDYFKQLKKEKKTVIFVSHDISALQEYCTRGILIEKGQKILEGKITDVVDSYTRLITKKETDDISDNTKTRKLNRVGVGKIVVEKVSIKNGDKIEAKLFDEKDSKIVVTVSYRFYKNSDSPIYGVSIFDAAGQRLIASNTMWQKVKVASVKSDSTVKVTWEFPNIFNSGTFTITPAVAEKHGTVMQDQVDDMVSFKIRKNKISNAFTSPAHKITVGR